MTDHQLVLSSALRRNIIVNVLEMAHDQSVSWHMPNLSWHTPNRSHAIPSISLMSSACHTPNDLMAYTQSVS